MHAELTEALIVARIAVDPAQAEGTLTGMLCLQPQMSMAKWIGVILEDTASETVTQAALEELSGCGTRTRDMLQSDDLEFTPSLPPDAVALNERLRALGEWCSGYLYGLAVAGLADFDALSEQGREFIEDVTDLTRLVARPEPEAIDESRYMELVEYVKIGVLSMADELQSKPLPGAGGGDNKQLH